MDSKEAVETTHNRKLGRSVTEEGIYHSVFMPAYKGGVKGELGGVVIGAGIGLAIGLIAVAGLSLTVGVTTPLALAIVGGITAAGMWHYVHKFENVGIVSGAVAAAHEQAETREREYEKAQFQEIKKEINDIKSALQIPDRPSTGESVAAVEKRQENDYPMSHYDHEHANHRGSVIFAKVAAIGAVIGAIAGAIASQAAGGGLEHILGPLIGHELGANAAVHALTGALIGAAAGGTLGINRDLFRQVFDVTDHWFKGILVPQKSKTPQLVQKIDTSPLPAQQPEITILSSHVSRLQAQAQPPGKLAFLPEPEVKIFIPDMREPERSVMFFRQQIGAQTMREALFNHDTSGPGH